MNQSGSSTAPVGAYELGHSDREIDRLATQARVIDPITRGFFRDAGIASGMRVMDVGSGAGDVAFLAADLVGETGEVVGVDRAAAALAVARSRAKARGLGNVSFLEGDPSAMTFERAFDAVLGRLVLMFQSDPSAMLRRLATHLRPGGCVVFHEIDWDGVRSFPPAPLYDQCCRWASETIRRSGAQIHMGMRMHSTFIAAGLPAPTLRVELLAHGGVNGEDGIHLLADLARTLLPEMERLGIATAADSLPR